MHADLGPGDLRLWLDTALQFLEAQRSAQRLARIARPAADTVAADQAATSQPSLPNAGGASDAKADAATRTRRLLLGTQAVVPAAARIFVETEVGAAAADSTARATSTISAAAAPTKVAAVSGSSAVGAATANTPDPASAAASAVTPAASGSTSPSSSPTLPVNADSAVNVSAAGSVTANATDYYRSLPSDRIGAASGLPLVRRVLLAQFLVAWFTSLDQKLPADADTQTALRRLFEQLYDIHVESVVDRSVLAYFHISKAGGTSWSKAASLNGCEAPKSRGRRFPPFDDSCRWLNRSALASMGYAKKRCFKTPWARYGWKTRRSGIISCQQRFDAITKYGYSYFTNEYTLVNGLQDMYDAHPCPQFVNAINIREPTARLLSNIKFMLPFLRESLYNKRLPPNGPEVPPTFEDGFCNAPGALWEALTPPITDNYNIRTLLGETGFHTPLGGIGPAHEQVAKQQLVQFDLVMDLNGGHQAAEAVMRSGLGWQTTLAEVTALNGSALVANRGFDVKACGVGNISSILERQGPDLRWYRFGRTLARLDTLLFAVARALGREPWPSDAAERGLVRGESDQEQGCGLVGLGRRPSDGPWMRKRKRNKGKKGPAAKEGAAENKQVEAGVEGVEVEEEEEEVEGGSGGEDYSDDDYEDETGGTYRRVHAA
ncbi:hypothetical protein HYH03_014629 [Edaphochlamys debaryana]|uniref:Uncharacterized protein n=1 Tax=Edaphochlamys debaryana TaxID=47281 RepID=A0A836BRZ5_9CHLO|nr:hypothetical protein HYH03_014629 [Edaphochlamys debaryana]|eukprot:KAG2486700.1 hypothetical protein HYH03_014629 [Edaphochlamys debaryana]